MTVSAPASSSALRGSIISTCSKPSVIKIATRVPLRLSINPSIGFGPLQNLAAVKNSMLPGAIGVADVRYNRIVAGFTEGGTMTEPSYEELKSRVAELEKQGGGRRSGALEFRVGEKGGVSVYGLGRFPVTLYYEQWIRLLDTAPQVREFLEENKSNGKLKLKEGSAAAGGH